MQPAEESTEAPTQTVQPAEESTEAPTQTVQPAEESTEALTQAVQPTTAKTDAEEAAKEKAEAAKQAAELAEENAGSTAVSGRIERALSLIRYKMSGSQYIIGVSDSVENVDFNLPGFFATMYKYGIIGTVLSYIFYLCCAVFAKGPYRWMGIIIVVTSFFSAHTHGTFYMLFYVLMLMDGVIFERGENSK